jgi:hypothetical protein
VLPTIVPLACELPANNNVVLPLDIQPIYQLLVVRDRRIWIHHLLDARDNFFSSDSPGASLPEDT